jgi:hypothetical protein
MHNNAFVATVVAALTCRGSSNRAASATCTEGRCHYVRGPMATVQKPDYSKKRTRDDFESMRGEVDARKAAQHDNPEGECVPSPGCKSLDKK